MRIRGDLDRACAGLLPIVTTLAAAPLHTGSQPPGVPHPGRSSLHSPGYSLTKPCGDTESVRSKLPPCERYT